MLFSEIVAAQRKGGMLQEAQEKLAKVVKQTIDTGKTGELVIKLKIKMSDENSVVIEDSVTAKIPEKMKHGSSFFTDEEGMLHKDDPNQGEFPVVTEAIEAQQ